MRRIILVAATLTAISVPVAAQQMMMHGSGEPGHESQQAAMPNMTAAQTEFMVPCTK